MRSFLALLLATTALPTLADTIPATSKITGVTIFAEGAKITREVSFDVPAAGTHDLLITDLPAATLPDLIQIETANGLSIGAFSLRDDRMPPREDPLTPEQLAAKAAVETAEAAERTAQMAVDAVQARIQAANAQAAFLGSFSGALPDTATPETIKAMAAMIGAETLAASETAAAAKADLWAAEKALTDAQEARTKAEEAFAALPARDTDYTALAVSLDAAAAGPTTLIVTTYMQEASWKPVYNMNLSRKDGNRLTIERSVLVSQKTGEDWSSVDLVLSTATPSDQSSPGALWPDLRQIGPEEPAPEAMMEDDRLMAGAAPAEPVMEPEVVYAAPMLVGDTVVYAYPRKVDVASGVEDLRLALDKLEVTPKVAAWAVPRYDSTAFVMATFTNESDEPLLAGVAMIFREGVLVAGTYVEQLAPGVETDIAFGALDAIQIKREMPKRTGGESGFISTTNEQSETATLTIENLGDETWPVRVFDQVPYSEQDDLQIEFTANPAATEADVDGQRGILAWDFDLPPGEKKEISLGYTMSWPEGMVLR